MRQCKWYHCLQLPHFIHLSKLEKCIKNPTLIILGLFIFFFFIFDLFSYLYIDAISTFIHIFSAAALLIFGCSRAEFISFGPPLIDLALLVGHYGDVDCGLRLIWGRDVDIILGVVWCFSGLLSSDVAEQLCLYKKSRFIFILLYIQRRIHKHYSSTFSF